MASLLDILLQNRRPPDDGAVSPLARFKYADNPIGTETTYAVSAAPPSEPEPWYSNNTTWNDLTKKITAATAAIPAGPMGIPGHVVGGTLASLTGLLGQMENAANGQPVDPAAVTSGMMNFAIPGMMMRPKPGALNVFAGPMAKTADLNSLREAQGLAASGAAPKDIWSKTGWFAGEDGKWKFEIPDTGAAWTDKVRQNPFNKDMLSFSFKPSPMSDLMTHDALFAAYPHLRDVPVTSTPPFSAFSGLRGAVYDSGKIGLTGAKPQEAMSTALHEIQHKIQEHEGFAGGGTVAQFTPADLGKAETAARATLKPYEDRMNAAGVNYFTVRRALEDAQAGRRLYDYQKTALDQAALTPEQAREFLVRSRVLDELAARRNEAFKSYENLPGERESRVIEERFKNNDYSSFPGRRTP